MKALGLGTLLIVAVAVSALLDDETGIRIWRELRADLQVAQARLGALARENEALRREIRTLEREPAAIDRAIREELDLGLPGEIVVRFEGSSGGVLAEAPEGPRGRQERR